MGQSFDGRVDQYAVAVTVYELLAGRRPFLESGTAVMVRLGQAEGPPELRAVCPSVSEALSKAIQPGLAKDPAQRYPSGAAFASAVVAAVARLRKPRRPPIRPRSRSRRSGRARRRQALRLQYRRRSSRSARSILWEPTRSRRVVAAVNSALKTVSAN